MLADRPNALACRSWYKYANSAIDIRDELASRRVDEVLTDGIDRDGVDEAVDDGVDGIATHGVGVTDERGVDGIATHGVDVADDSGVDSFSAPWVDEADAEEAEGIASGRVDDTDDAGVEEFATLGVDERNDDGVGRLALASPSGDADRVTTTPDFWESIFRCLSPIAEVLETCTSYLSP